MNGKDVQETPVYGQRLLPRIIDDRARKEPDLEWLSIPRTSDPVDGWEKVTYGQAAKAINRVAHKIIDIAGQAKPGEFPTIAYIGPNDSRYLVFLLGAVKAGYKALFVSPRNSAEGQLRLFNATDCQAIASSTEFEPAVQSWVQHRPMKSFVLGAERELLADTEDVSHIPYEKDFSEAQWEPLVVLHTSGSSGFPKPIVLKHGNIAGADGMRNVPPKYGTIPWVPEIAARSTRILSPLPLFHIGGLYFAIFYSTFYSSLSLGISNKPVTADLVHQCILHSGADAVMLPPSVVDDLAGIPEYYDTLRKLKLLAWGGGSVTPQNGDRLVKNGVMLCNLTSSTEAGAYPFRLQANPENWQYFIFDYEYGGNEFRRLPGDDEIYQHFFKRQSAHPGLQGIFWTFPDIDEFDTKDLYKPHPTLQDHWLYYGRADNIIVFSNGEKLNPVSIEATVLSHPLIKGVVVVGSKRLEPALILEPVNHPKDDQEAKELIQSVWPLVQEANRDTVAHGQIQQDMIMLTSPDRPFPRAGKGTIQRPVAVQLYEKEISQLYENASREPEVVPVIDISSESSLRKSIEAVVLSKLDVPALDHDTDFFTLGMDSLQVMVISRLLTAGLKAAGVDVGSSFSARTVYANPSVNRLAQVAAHLSNQAPSSETSRAAQNGVDGGNEMRDMVEKYTKGLPEQTGSKPPPREVGQTVLLTGSTGGLGSYLLDVMISSDSIEKVICLNRSEGGGRQRQMQSCSERGLTTDFTKCEFLQADLSLPDFGLGETYNRVVDTVDRIIHNAWPVNFNIPLSSFEPSIRGVRHLVDLSIKAPKQVPIVFISSIGSVDGWTNGNVPEEPIQDLGMAAMGYGKSKQISSLILDEATRVSGVPTASIRVGQIGGPRGNAGAWSRREWLPSIIASSLHLGTLPTDLGRLSIVDWVPIEDVAHVIVEISQQKVEDIRGYFHCVNPAKTTWSELAPAVKEYYGSRITQLVTFAEWVQLLRKSSAVTRDVRSNPGIKLIDTYEAQANTPGIKQVLLDMERTKKHVARVRKLEAITPALIQNWCRQWKF